MVVGKAPGVFPFPWVTGGSWIERTAVTYQGRRLDDGDTSGTLLSPQFHEHWIADYVGLLTVTVRGAAMEGGHFNDAFLSGSELRCFSTGVG